jgi:hypothetical protein
MMTFVNLSTCQLFYEGKAKRENRARRLELGRLVRGNLRGGLGDSRKVVEIMAVPVRCSSSSP